MKPIDAIRTAITRAAELITISNRGRIDKDLLAAIVGVPDNPLENIQAIEKVSFVMKAEKVYKNVKSIEWVYTGIATARVSPDYFAVAT